ncbi:neutral/alkaline non-lysosomal ceramidase N-terminal domain-containing protein [Cohnella soli]|uniref:Neutral/alkaline non-lysosomal ceramidase N-terminal domain-containing protein n=1 Tax=Cohnella soli TaxID=425005 RepID=A0ABW0HKF3_9BACL
MGNNFQFQVGVGKEDITPDADGYIVGGLYPRKTRFIKDPLFSKALVIDNGMEKIAIVSLDLILLLSEDVGIMKTEIEKATGIPADNIFLCASHTHSGPYTSIVELNIHASYLERNHIHTDIKERHISYMNKLRELVVRSAVRANDDLEACKLGTANADANGVSHNRRLLKENDDCWNSWLLTREEGARYPSEGPVDPNVFVMAAVKADGTVKALLYNFAVHACNNPTLECVSADFPGVVERVVSKSLGYDVMTFYMAGPCGNINSNLDSDELGARIGEEILISVASLNFPTKNVLRVQNVEIDLPLRENIELQEEEIKRKWPDGLDFFSHSNQLLQSIKKPSYKAVLSGIRLGDTAMVTMPLELFVEFGLDIKKRSPFANTTVATLTNGCLGYVPTLRAFENGGYETFNTTNSYLTLQAGNELVPHSVAILNRLYGEETSDEG